MKEKRFKEPDIQKAIASLEKLKEDFQEIDRQIEKIDRFWG